jgi:hypothetical protein
MVICGWNGDGYAYASMNGDESDGSYVLTSAYGGWNGDESDGYAYALMNGDESDGSYVLTSARVYWNGDGYAYRHRDVFAISVLSALFSVIVFFLATSMGGVGIPCLLTFVPP